MLRAEMNTRSANAGASHRPAGNWFYAAQAALLGLCLFAPPVWAQQVAEPRETSVTANGLVRNLLRPRKQLRPVAGDDCSWWLRRRPGRRRPAATAG